MNTKQRYIIAGIYANAQGAGPEWAKIEAIGKLRRLARQHQRQCENSCNGEGVVKGQRYYNGTIDDYARRTYGASVKSAYVHEGKSDETIFDDEIERIQEKMCKIAEAVGLICRFQHDPRGWTCKLIEARNGHDNLTLTEALYI